MATFGMEPIVSRPVISKNASPGQQHLLRSGSGSHQLVQSGLWNFLWSAHDWHTYASQNTNDSPMCQAVAKTCLRSATIKLCEE